MPTLQVMAMIALSPIGPPTSRPRTAWMTGVNGWYSANHRSPTGIVLVGTKPLPRNGKSIIEIDAVEHDLVTEGLLQPGHRDRRPGRGFRCHGVSLSEGGDGSGPPDHDVAEVRPCVNLEDLVGRLGAVGGLQGVADGAEAGVSVDPGRGACVDAEVNLAESGLERG